MIAYSPGSDVVSPSPSSTVLGTRPPKPYASTSRDAPTYGVCADTTRTSASTSRSARCARTVSARARLRSLGDGSGRIVAIVSRPRSCDSALARSIRYQRLVGLPASTRMLGRQLLAWNDGRMWLTDHRTSVIQMPCRMSPQRARARRRLRSAQMAATSAIATIVATGLMRNITAPHPIAPRNETLQWTRNVGPERWAPQEALAGRHQVDDGVRRQEEHGEHGCDRVEVADRDRAEHEQQREVGAEPRFVVGAGTAAEEAERLGKDVVAGERLQDSWRTEDAPERARQRGPPDADQDGGPPERQLPHHERIVDQRRRVGAPVEHHRDDHVQHVADARSRPVFPAGSTCVVRRDRRSC